MGKVCLKKKSFVKEILFDYESVIFYLHLSYLKRTPVEEVWCGPYQEDCNKKETCSIFKKSVYGKVC